MYEKKTKFLSFQLIWVKVITSICHFVTVGYNFHIVFNALIKHMGFGIPILLKKLFDFFQFLRLIKHIFF